MSSEARVRNYWREEFSLVALLLVFFTGIVVLSLKTPFDARLFPIVIGSAGLLLTLAVAVEQVRRCRRPDAASVVGAHDPVAKASWPRFATALLAAPAFGFLFWLFGFIIPSLVAMLLMPVLMGYTNRRRLVLIAVLTVALLAVIFPYLLNIALPHGLVGDWIIDQLALRAG